MSNGHGSSRRRSYGRRQKELRDRRSSDLAIDLEGPASWPRGGAWETGSSRQVIGRADPGNQSPGGPA